MKKMRVILVIAALAVVGAIAVYAITQPKPVEDKQVEIPAPDAPVAPVAP